MKKQLTEKTVYQPNERVKITVNNTPEMADGVMTQRYGRKVTIAVEMGFSRDKISFSTTDDILKFIESIDVEDPQQELPINDKEK